MAERPKRVMTKEHLQRCRALRQRILDSRGGIPLPDSTDIIRAHRDGTCTECGRDVLDVTEQHGMTITSVEIIRSHRDAICMECETSGNQTEDFVPEDPDDSRDTRSS